MPIHHLSHLTPSPTRDRRRRLRATRRRWRAIRRRLRATCRLLRATCHRRAPAAAGQRW